MKEIKQLLEVTNRLRIKYDRGFPLDGRLVGDIGEVLAKEKYGLKLYSENNFKHDGEELTTGRKIQVKSSFKNYCYFPYGVDKIPDYFLALNILETGKLEELFNGPGKFIYTNYIMDRKLKPYKKSYYTLSKGVLLKLNHIVPSSERIKIVNHEL